MFKVKTLAVYMSFPKGRQADGEITVHWCSLPKKCLQSFLGDVPVACG